MACAMVALKHPVTTAFPHTVVLSTHTATQRPATSTESTSVVRAIAPGFNHIAITATQILAHTTRISITAIITKHTSAVRAPVLVGLNRPLATVILLVVTITQWVALATNISIMPVVVVALALLS